MIDPYSNSKKTLLNYSALSLSLLGIAVTLVLMNGCTAVSPSASASRDTYQAESTNYVTIYLDGDVKFHGDRRIRRALSKESIMEAAGGFAGLSQISPRSITLTRGGQRYRIPFNQMGKDRWKDFLLQDGDKIVVNRVIF